ncbi:hypothetical protein FC36_GL001357 [Ligilactobacillus equi DSM 15833 = JCM 10991]|uniref:Uncharacterized protein n=2 Tax=Ligilactobacillus equi TaxID=137357 RepID=A0A0R1TTQ7_9LACO|nr:hypothetical protein FC36_GL001357 [Ligilactobacillus equi DSM 15833 = JCM 10991]
MENKKYVTHDELRISQLETQNKLDKIDSKIDQSFVKIDNLEKRVDDRFDSFEKRIDDKFNSIPMIIENAMLKEREYQRNQQKENRRFFWGTIIIGGIGAVAGVVSIIISLL